MKTRFFLLIGFTAAMMSGMNPCRAALGVTMDLSGAVLKSGSTLMVTSGLETIQPASIYTYSITGTVTGNGRLALLTGTGIDIASFFEEVDPKLAPYLTGTVLNVSGKLPYTCVNKLETGTYAFSLGSSGSAGLSDAISLSGSGYIIGTARLKAGIKATGQCYGEITNTKFQVKLPIIGTRTDGTDSVTFSDGSQIVIQPVFGGGTPQPDLSFLINGNLADAGVTGTDPSNENVTTEVKSGATKSVVVVLQNRGPAADTFQLTTTEPSLPYKEHFIYKGVDITRKVEDGDFVTPEIAAGAVLTLTWEISSADSSGFALSSAALTATSKTNGSVDAVGFTAVH